MRNLLLTLVASVSFIFSGCSGIANANSVIKLGDMRFITNAETSVGLTLKEAIEKYGPAHEVIKEGCAIPLVEDGKPVGIAAGTQFSYMHTQTNMYASRDMCIVEGVVVGDVIRFVVQKGNRISSQIFETIDAGLAGELVLKDQDAKSKSDSLRDYNDPKIPQARKLEI